MAECCNLIDSRDFCKFVKGIDLDKALPSAQLANIDIRAVVGDTCYALLCAATDDDLNTLLADCIFQAYYSRLIEYYWLIDCGDGANAATGFTTKQADDFSEFRVISSSDLPAKLAQKKNILEGLRKSFVGLFDAGCHDCFYCEPEEEVCNGCTRTKKCACGSCQTSGCNSCGGCDSCSTCSCSSDYASGMAVV